MDVTPQTADTVEIRVSLHVVEQASFGTFDNQGFILSHLGKGVPQMMAIPIGQRCRTGRATIFGGTVERPVHLADPVTGLF